LQDGLDVGAKLAQQRVGLLAVALAGGEILGALPLPAGLEGADLLGEPGGLAVECGGIGAGAGFEPQRGAFLPDVASYFSTSLETIERVYWHHSPDHQRSAVEAMDRRK